MSKKLQFLYALLNKPTKTLVIVVLCGILIRLVLMPITYHDDLLSATLREALYVFEGAYGLGNFSELLVSGYLKLTQSLFYELPDSLSMLQNINSISINEKGQAAFLASRTVFRYLFLLKIPFLIADIGVLILLWKFFDDYKKRLTAVALWAVNPFVLYPVFVWGRHEIFPILCIMAALYLIKKNSRFIWPMILLGVAIHFRSTFLLLLPFFALYCGKDWKGWLAYSVIPFITFNILSAVFTCHSCSLQLTLGGGYSAKFTNYLFAGSIGNDFTSTGLFIVSYVLVFYFFLNEKFKKTLSFKKLVNYSLIGMFTFYAFSTFHPHYIAWLSPVFILSAVMNRKLIPFVFFLFGALILFADIYFGPYSALYLFLPFNSEFVAVIGGICNQLKFINWPKEYLVTISHTFFVVVMLIITLIIFKDNESKD